jgi:hypothetical protein
MLVADVRRGIQVAIYRLASAVGVVEGVNAQGDSRNYATDKQCTPVNKMCAFSAPARAVIFDWRALQNTASDF